MVRQFAAAVPRQRTAERRGQRAHVARQRGHGGPIHSVIGIKAPLAVHRFRSHMPTKFEVASGAVLVQGAVVTVDAESGRASAISRIRELVERS
jgi:calcineurin-like phosphoesterase